MLNTKPAKEKKSGINEIKNSKSIEKIKTSEVDWKNNNNNNNTDKFRQSRQEKKRENPNE